MTTNVAIWDRDIGMPRRSWATLWRALGLRGSGSRTSRMRVADLDHRMLRDIGFEPQSLGSGHRSARAGRPPSAAERR
jgi:hypothetical protein